MSGYLGDSLGSRGISADSLLQKPNTSATLCDRVRLMLGSD